MNQQRTGTGTREWSEHSVNALKTGCRYGCLYCYARARALRFGLIETGSEWSKRCIMRNCEHLERDSRRRYKGVVMFPTTHDIYDHQVSRCGCVAPLGNLRTCEEVLRNLIDAGNRVLLVTKADPSVIVPLIERLPAKRYEQLEVRVTLGTLDGALARLWEPGAPDPDKRMEAMQGLRRRGVRVSASAEPLLDAGDGAVRLVAALHELVDGEVWVGTMNDVRRRTRWALDEPDAGVDRSALRQAIRRIEDWGSAAAVRIMTRELEGFPRVRFKDRWRKLAGLDSTGGQD